MSSFMSLPISLCTNVPIFLIGMREYAASGHSERSEESQGFVNSSRIAA
jgi:hypothetical protein